MKVGLRAAAEFHEQNTGSLPYTPLKLTESGAKVKVRFLAGTPKEDENKVPIIENGKRYVGSLYMHSKFQVVSERCLSDEETADPLACPLCRVKAPRTLKTYLPLRERGDNVPNRVKFWVVGRDVVNSLLSAEEEIPDHDMTSIDFIIKRVGAKLQTKYELYPQESTRGPLGPKELSLEFPDPDDMIAMKSEDEIERIAVEYDRAQNATRTGGGRSSDDDDESDVPF